MLKWNRKQTQSRTHKNCRKKCW